MVGTRVILLGVWALAVPVIGCGEGEEAPASSAATPRTTSTATPAPPDGQPRDRPPAPVDLPALDCPSELTNCETASGQILYVERVDPDGDGDAHFVLLSGEGITAPGISVVDVRPDLRPRPLPGRGDLLAAAGPVYEGSFGQRQIEAIEVAVEGRSG